jgi:hypothetical protein
MVTMEDKKIYENYCEQIHEIANKLAENQCLNQFQKPSTPAHQLYQQWKSHTGHQTPEQKKNPHSKNSNEMN